jgi:hypothetical protein
VLPPHEFPITVPVSIVNFAFVPEDVTINVGDTVMWTNNDPFAHTTTSDSGVWDSGSLSSGATFSFTFTTAGSFPYHCTIHPTMIGTITVLAGATPTGDQHGDGNTYGYGYIHGHCDGDQHTDQYTNCNSD